MDSNTYIEIVPEIRCLAASEALRLLQNTEDADDVAQDVLLKLWEYRDYLHGERSRMMAFARTTTHNLCLDRLKSRRRSPFLRLWPWGNDGDDGEAAGHEWPTLDTPQRRLEMEEADGIVRQALERLPYKWRTVIVMRNVDGMEFGEIAAIMGTTEGAVRVILSRARARMMEVVRSLG